MEEAVFLYDDNESYEANFSIWFRMNTDERRLLDEFLMKCMGEKQLKT
jgi:hypothetical protein